MFESGLAVRDGIELAADVHLAAESAFPRRRWSRGRRRVSVER
jgi:hypothetical protein